jgi:hypothetical protein
MDYPTLIATATAHLVPLVAILAVEGTATSTGIAPVGTSIFDIATAVSAVFLAGITPTGMVLGTVLAPAVIAVHYAPVVIIGAYIITAFTYVSAVITHLVITI